MANTVNIVACKHGAVITASGETMHEALDALIEAYDEHLNVVCQNHEMYEIKMEAVVAHGPITALQMDKFMVVVV